MLSALIIRRKLMDLAKKWDSHARRAEESVERAWAAGYVRIARELSHVARSHREQANAARVAEASHLQQVK
jgi:hypothetical protein